MYPLLFIDNMSEKIFCEKTPEIVDEINIIFYNYFNIMYILLHEFDRSDVKC